MALPKQPGDVIIEVADDKRSIDEVTLADGNTVLIGTPVGKITASGKFAVHNPAASDGSEVCAGVAIEGIEASGNDEQIAIVNLDALLRESGIEWGAMSAPEQAAARDALFAHGIKFR